MINIEFDRAKEAKNRQKHGFSLEIGSIVIESAVDIEVDEHEEEVRWRAYGWFEGRPMFASTRCASRTFIGSSRCGKRPNMR